MTCQREKELIEKLTQSEAMYSVSSAKLIKAGKRIAELEALNGALCRDSAGFVQERDVLAAQADAIRSKVYSATICHPNGVQYLLEEGLALPDISEDILRDRDARTLRNAAIRIGNEFAFATYSGCVNALNLMADELEQAK